VNIEDKKRFALLMALLQTIWSKESLTMEKVELYFDVLKDIPIETINQAINGMIKTRVRDNFPLPAEIRIACVGNREFEEKALALKLWNVAAESFYGDGTTKMTNDERELLHKTIKLAFGNWERFGMTSRGDEEWDRKHFLECFKIIRQQEINEKLIEQGKREDIKELKELRKLGI
jgi:hypothetical protein